MIFAAPIFLFFIPLAGPIAALLALGAVYRKRAAKSFGDAERVQSLTTHDPSVRRGWKARISEPLQVQVPE